MRRRRAVLWLVWQVRPLDNPSSNQPIKSTIAMSRILACKNAIAAREAENLAGSIAKFAAARHASILVGWTGRHLAKGTKDTCIRHVNENPGSMSAPAAAAMFMSSESSHGPYTPPANVLEWEKLATKELGRSKTGQTVESLRTSRTTPEGIAVQPVYYDLDSSAPEMPGVYPFTRGPYATMYTVRPWTVRQ